MPETQNRHPKQWSTEAHDQHAHASLQTATTLSHQSNTLTVTSSRGFAREMAPMNSTSPAHRSRRYTIDVSVPRGAFPLWRDYQYYTYGTVAEDFAPPQEPRPQQVCAAESKLSGRQTDEPMQPRLRLPLPDPLRYRDLHRWGRIKPFNNDDLYISIDMGAARLTNSEFCSIVHSVGIDSWYPNDVLDTALYLLSKYYDAEANDIGIVDSNSIQCIRWAACDDENLDSLSMYKSMLEDKKWIFIPLNTGMEETSADTAHGSHWSLLAIDRRHGRAHYVDGFESTRYSDDWQKMAEESATAVGRILGEKYATYIEQDAPDQWANNLNGQNDFGPCGPYVVRMVQFYIEYILNLQRSGREDEIDLYLDFGVKDVFHKNFDSVSDRWNLVYTVAGVKASQVTDARSREHDQAALGSPSTTWKPAPMFYDAPMFTNHCLTRFKSEKYQQLQIAAEQGDHSTLESDSSSSSGGVPLADETERSSLRSVRINAVDEVEQMDTEMGETEKPHSHNNSDDRNAQKAPSFEKDHKDQDWVHLNRIQRTVSSTASQTQQSEDEFEWSSVFEF